MKRGAFPYLMEWMRQAIVDAYLDGEKRASIAAEFGVQPNHVRMLAASRGIPPRAARGRPKKVKFVPERAIRQ